MHSNQDIFPVKITIRGLVKRYHFRAVLDQLTLTLKDGCFCVLVGANGAGKTTLLRILATLVRPDQGEIKLGDEPYMTDASIRRKIGYVGHQPMFYHDLTAAENLYHYARLYACPYPNQRVSESIHSAGLTDFKDQPVRTFSRGMQQRLSIARALLHEPDILLFDEPYTGLDQDAARLLDRRLTELHQPGRIILLAAHRPQRLIPLATHIAWLKNGIISHHLPVSRLHESPDLQDYMQESQ